MTHNHLSGNAYLNWLETRLQDETTSDAEYQALRKEWNNLLFLQHQVNMLNLQKPSRVNTRVAKVDFSAVVFADTIAASPTL